MTDDRPVEVSVDAKAAAGGESPVPDANVRRDSSVRAVITRANGEVVDLGVVDRQFANPIKHRVWRIFCKPLADRRIRRANRRLKKAN